MFDTWSMLQVHAPSGEAFVEAVQTGHLFPPPTTASGLQVRLGYMPRGTTVAVRHRIA